VARFDVPALRQLLRPAGRVCDCRKSKQGSANSIKRCYVPQLFHSRAIDRYTEIQQRRKLVMVKMNKCEPAHGAAFVPALGAAFVLGLALSAVATPSFAQRSEHNGAGEARERVIEQCSREASKYKQPTWGSQEVTAYRACMGAHGQPE
jgi:hypothetical protein